MNSIIIYNQPNGSVAYVIACGDTPIDEVQRKDVPQGVESEIVEREKVLPVDEYFRDAWTWAGKGQPVLEDLEKSKAIHRDNIRAARLPLLQAKDLEFQRAQETSADTAAIVTAKQALRDAPAAAAIDAAKTADELKAAWDTSLLGDSPYA